jgi:hypothetical protein
VWDARRRNRNLGTAKAGRGARNRFAIPERDADLSRYWERLSDYVAVERALGSHRLVFLVEPTRPDCLHHCTIDDVLRVLRMLPFEHVSQIALVVMRQPTRKQERLRPVWGRIGYWSQIGGRAGPGVYLDAQPIGLALEWGKRLRPDDEAELERFRACGFEVEPHARGWRVRASSAAIRQSQLYRTLPHELGHLADMAACRRSLDWNGDEDRFWERYFARSEQEREAAAHRYADEFRRDARARGLIPFASTFDAAALRADRLDPAWFARVEP